MAIVKLTGSGQMNGVVIINKTLDLDEAQAKTFVGRNRKQVIIQTLEVYYPGVQINPDNIAVVVTPEKKKPSSSKKNSGKKKSVKSLISKAFVGSDDNVSENSHISVLADVRDLIGLKLSQNEKELSDQLDTIYLKLAVLKWDITEHPVVKENNKLLDSCLLKYKMGLIILSQQASNQLLLIRHKQQYQFLRKRKVLTKYWLLILIGVIFAVMSVLFSLGVVR